MTGLGRRLAAQSSALGTCCQINTVENSCLCQTEGLLSWLLFMYVSSQQRKKIGKIKGGLYIKF